MSHQNTYGRGHWQHWIEELSGEQRDGKADLGSKAAEMGEHSMTQKQSVTCEDSKIEHTKFGTSHYLDSHYLEVLAQEHLTIMTIFRI